MRRRWPGAGGREQGRRVFSGRRRESQRGKGSAARLPGPERACGKARACAPSSQLGLLGRRASDRPGSAGACCGGGVTVGGGNCVGRDVAVRLVAKLYLETSHSESIYTPEICILPAHHRGCLTTKSPKAREPNFETTTVCGGAPLTVPKPLTYPLQKVRVHLMLDRCQREGLEMACCRRPSKGWGVWAWFASGGH